MSYVPGVRAVLRTRVITALVMLAVLYAATAWLPPFAFALFISAVLLVAVHEWSGLMGLTQNLHKALYLVVFAVLMAGLSQPLGLRPAAVALDREGVLVVCGLGVLFWLFAFTLLKAYPDNRDRWTGVGKTAVIGFLTLLPTWCALIQLKYLEPRGYLVLALVGLVSIVDIGAFFVGRRFGKSKLAPKLSPQKSWAGFWGGMASCLLLSLVLLYPMHQWVQPLDVSTAVALVVMGLVVAVFSVVGDLFESMLKRSQGLKDSGRSLPGHGGVLDRIDSLTAAAPVFVFFLMILVDDLAWQ